MNKYNNAWYEMTSFWIKGGKNKKLHGTKNADVNRTISSKCLDGKVKLRAT